MLKRLVLLFAVLALVAAACGGDDGAEEETTTTTEATGGGGEGGQATGESTLDQAAHRCRAVRGSEEQRDRCADSEHDLDSEP